MITQQELKQRLYYDPETGAFTWLRHRWLDKVGKRADSFEIDKGGYIWLDDKNHRTNRLAFLYMTGEIPVNGCAHEFGAKSMLLGFSLIY